MSPLDWGSDVIAEGTGTEQGQELGTCLHVRVCVIWSCVPASHPADPSFFGPWQVLRVCCAGRAVGGKARVHLGRPRGAHSCMGSVMRDKCPSVVQKTFLSAPLCARLQPGAPWPGPPGIW